MNKIVQLTEYEYEQLKKRADLSTKTLEAEIKREMKDHCNLTVELKMDVGRDWDDVYHIKPVVYAHSGMYSDPDSKPFHNTVYALSYKEVGKIQAMVQKWMDKQIRKRYKLDLEMVNKCRARLQNQWKWNVLFLLLSLTGWLVACFAIFS